MKKYGTALWDKYLPAAIFCLLWACCAQAQTLQPVSAWGYKWNRGVFVHGLGIPADTATLTTEQRAFPHLGIKGETLYRWSPAQNKWVAPGGSSFDTTSLSNRIDQRVKYTDTAAMLTNYRHWLAGYLTSADISGKLNISDTASMLANYRHWLAGYLKAADIAGKLNISDTAAMLLTYRHWAAGYLTNITGLVTAGSNVTVTGSGTAGSPYVINATASGTTVDTTSLSNRINQKLNISDTAGKWVGYIFKSNDSVYYDIGGTRYFAYIDEGSELCPSSFSGGVVVYDEGTLTANISPSPYYHINCRRYSSTGGQITHDPPDATYPRYDIVAFDTLGNVVIIEGTPAENPSIPYVDETLYKALTTTLIIPGDTDPADLSTEVIYNENTEWTTARTIPGGTFTSTAQVFTGTVSSSVIGWANGQYLQFTNSTELSPSAYQTFSFWLRLTANMANNQNISVQFFNGSTAVSNSVTATITKNAVNTWQLVGFTIGQFTFTQPTFTRVRIIFSGSSASTLYVDLVRLQGGVSQGGGTTSQPLVITDGTTNVTVKTPLKFRGDGKVTFTVGSNTTHGDFVLGQINVDSLTGIPIPNITGLQDELNSKVTDVFANLGAEKDTFLKRINGVDYTWYITPVNEFNEKQFVVNNITGGQRVTIRPTPSAVATDSVLWIGADSTLYQSPAPSGGGSGMDSVHITQPTDNRLIFAQMQGGSAFRTDTIDINHPVLDTANKWVNLVEKINDSTLRVWKYGVATDIEINGNGGAGGSSYWSLSGSDIHNNNAGKVGITATGTAPTYTGLLTVQATSLGATANSTNNNAGITLSTGTAAALGAQQMSAPLTFYGNGYGTTPAQSFTVGYRNYLLPVQAAPAPTASLRWDVINSSGTPTNEMILTGGSLTVTGNMNGNGGFFTGGLYLTGTGSNRIISFTAGGANPRALIGSDNVTGNLAFRVNGASSLATGNLALSLQNATGSMLVNTSTENYDAQLKVESTTKGFLLTGMTQAQRDAMNLTLTSVTITNGGTGYTSNPSVVISAPAYGGLQAVGTATRTGNVVTSIAVTTAGSYNSTPTITITGGGGSGATATANMTQVLTAGLEIYCSDCTATDGSTGVKQVWNGTTWKNLW